MSPKRARLYKPLTSLSSQILSELSINTSRKSLSDMIALAVDLFSLNGEIKAVITMCPVSTNILVISATRLMFSIRSLFEKPRSLLMPNLVLSPSNTIEWIPLSKSFLCSAFAKGRFSGTR